MQGNTVIRSYIYTAINGLILLWKRSEKIKEERYDTVIDKISEIEAAAGAIMRKRRTCAKGLAGEMEQKTAAFDEELESETALRIRKVQESMEADMNRKLEQQKADAEALIRQIEENYEKEHETYAEALLRP